MVLKATLERIEAKLVHGETLDMFLWASTQDVAFGNTRRNVTGPLRQPFNWRADPQLRSFLNRLVGHLFFALSICLIGASGS